MTSSDDTSRKPVAWGVMDEAGVVALAEVNRFLAEERCEDFNRTLRPARLVPLYTELPTTGTMRCHRGHENPAGLWNCPECTDHILNGVRTGRRDRATVKAVADSVERPYPERQFAPLSEEEMEVIGLVLRRSEIRSGLARLHADWARHWAEVIRRNAATIVEAISGDEA